MKRKSLFSKIFHKHLQKAGTNFSKMADDVGKLQGIFSYQKYDPITGLFLAKKKQFNTIVNQSKTNVIRLISQGASPWIGTIDPTDLAIQRMRFGNDNSHLYPSRLNYYKIAEPSSRPSIPLKQPGATVYSFAGGKSTATQILGTEDAGAHVIDTVPNAYSNFTATTTNMKTYDVPVVFASGQQKYSSPPSHGTLKVDLYLSSVLVETLYFGSHPTLDVDEVVYTRASDGIAPTYIQTVSGKSPVTTPDKEGTRGAGIIEKITDSTLTSTRLYYDYTSGAEGWKLKIEILDDSGTARFDDLTFTFEMGKKNVINSVIPTQGYNAGTGRDLNTRFQSYQDYYSIMSNQEYRDAETDFIDDYSVTFAVNMTGQYGNGQATSADSTYIRYTEAFLFNGLDDMFSAVHLTEPFDKNDGSAYYISWTILAPLN